MRPIVMIQPHEGNYNKVMKPWVPLSLLSAAIKLDQEGYPVRIIDQRVEENWKELLLRALTENPICLGVTSMTGSQILGAIEASRIVRSQNPNITIIWGGVHSTLFPEQTLANDFIDIVVKNEGEETFYHTVKNLEANLPLNDVAGICFKQADRIITNPERPFVNLDDYAIPPYHLIDVHKYIHQYFSEKQVVELESSRGCPYNCAFCYNEPYNHRKWRPLSPEKVVERLLYMKENYSLCSFHFVDDSFFISRERANEIMRIIIDRKLQVKLGFQGIRVNTMARITDEELQLLYKAGTRFLQFGVESGSPRMLEVINKRIKVEEVIDLNRRLAAFPDLIPYYNFMCGFPTETKEDVFQTTALAWQLLKENKKSLISPFHHYKPYPGTALASLAMSNRFDIPQTLEAWGHFDWTEAQKQEHNDMDRLLKKIEMVSILVDGKLEAQSDSALWTFMARLYRPIARFRLKNNYYSLMPEVMFLK
jgi:anaerobic magnesium-protoporphyrin IX monomethyl ester cyclase